MPMHIIAQRLGKGKTTILAAIALVQWFRGRRIYSNFWLSIPYTRISSVEDLNNVEHGDVFIDDGYLWFYTPVVGTNPIVSKILAFSRKRGLNIYITVNRTNQVHVNLRNCIEFIWVPLYLKDWGMLIVQKFEFLGDKEKCGDDERIGAPMGGLTLRNLPYAWSQFDTTEECKELVGVNNARFQRRFQP